LTVDRAAAVSSFFWTFSLLLVSPYRDACSGRHALIISRGYKLTCYRRSVVQEFTGLQNRSSMLLCCCHACSVYECTDLYTLQKVIITRNCDRFAGIAHQAFSSRL